MNFDKLHQSLKTLLHTHFFEAIALVLLKHPQPAVGGHWCRAWCVGWLNELTVLQRYAYLTALMHEL